MTSSAPDDRSEHSHARTGVPAFPPADPGPFTAGQSFGSRYRIVRLLGMGGMGAVYQAWDEELQIPVALKVIRLSGITDPAEVQKLEARFKRELLLARQVTHRNVVRIHDIGEIDGIKYLTMSFVEGDDLRTLLRRKGRLPVATALAIARHIATGLAAAHQAGVVHRDLKPANIMVQPRGRALIMDFGIATLTQPEWIASATTSTGSVITAAARPDPAIASTRSRTADVFESSTEAGVVGTLEFMAPEQARGEEVDQRADIYSFGLILLEMLLGPRPVPPMSRLEALQRRIQTPPESLRASDASIPDALDRLVVRCLQIDPAARFQTSAALVAALAALDGDGTLLKAHGRRQRIVPLAAAGLVSVAAVAAGTWWLSRPADPPAARAPLSVIIADFENSTGDATLEGSIEHSFGIALEGASFITAFPRPTALELASRLHNTTRITEPTARLIAIREGVNVVLAGRVERTGGGYRIAIRAVDPAGKPTADLSRTAAGKGDVLTAVSELASELRDEFGDTTPASARAAEAETFTTASLEAVREYALAQDLASAGKDEQAIAHYRAALERDPAFGRAQSGWAVSAWKIGNLTEAEAAYRRAFSQLDRMSEREKLRTLGAYYLQVARSYDKAIENYRMLVEQYPADRAGHSNLAISYFYVLDFARAMEEARLALEIYPRNPTFRSNYALFAMYASDFQLAAVQARQLVDVDASFHKGYLPIAVAAAHDGDLDLARQTYERMRAAGPLGASLAASGLGDLAIYSGRFDDAIEALGGAIDADRAAKKIDGEIAKRVALAEALVHAGRHAEARDAAIAVAALSRDLHARVPAARLLIALGRERDAKEIADDLASQLQPQKRAYAKIIEAEIALARRQPQPAVEALLAAKALTDHWLGRFLLGRGYVEAGHFAEAVSELDVARKRIGEASAVFFDDWPTLRYRAALPYWLGRAHEGLGALPAARVHYAGFLKLRPAAPGDPLAADAAARLQAIGR